MNDSKKIYLQENFNFKKPLRIFVEKYPNIQTSHKTFRATFVKIAFGCPTDTNATRDEQEVKLLSKSAEIHIFSY